MEKFLSSPIEGLLLGMSNFWNTSLEILLHGISNVDQNFRFVFSNMENFLSSPIENLFLGFSSIWNTVFISDTSMEKSESEEDESIISTTVLQVSKLCSVIFVGLQNSFNISMGYITSGLFFLLNNVFIGSIYFVYWIWNLLWSSILSLFLMVTSVLPSPDDILVPLPPEVRLK